MVYLIGKIKKKGQITLAILTLKSLLVLSDDNLEKKKSVLSVRIVFL